MHSMEMDMYLAIKNSNYSKVLDLIRNYDFNLTKYEFFNDKITFVSLACLTGNSAILELLINHGADVNRLSYVQYSWPSENQKFTNFEPALITATRHGNLKMCQLLLKNGAKVNKTDSFSMCALHWASSLNLSEIVRCLLTHEDVNLNILDLKNETPVDKAIQIGSFLIVYMFTQRFSLQFRFREYLLASIKNSNTEIFRLLLSQVTTGKVKFDLNLIDDSVGSLLHHAVILTNLNDSKVKERQESAFKIIQIPNIGIIQNLVDANKVEINVKNKLGETPLHVCRNVDVARLLLEKGANMNICEITGKMPLYTFICRANYDICIEMLKNGCDLENIDRLGNSLLRTIIHHSNAPVELIRLLLEAGVALNKEEWIQRKQFPQKFMQKHPKIVKAIEWRLKNPCSLKELSRKALRLHLNRINSSKSIVNSVNKLEKHLPSSLQDYVLLNLGKYGSVFLK